MHEPFYKWFEQMPLVCQQKLARIAWLLITEDMSDMGLSSEEILQKFKAYVVSLDIPIRKAAKMIMLVSLFDSIMENLSEFLKLDEGPFNDPQLEKKLVYIEKKMWQKLKDSWIRLRNRYYSDDLLYITLKGLIDNCQITI